MSVAFAKNFAGVPLKETALQPVKDVPVGSPAPDHRGRRGTRRDAGHRIQGKRTRAVPDEPSSILHGDLAAGDAGRDDGGNAGIAVNGEARRRAVKEDPTTRWKVLPVSVTLAPAAPTLGVSLIEGDTIKFVGLLAVPAVVVTESGSSCAPTGMVRAMLVTFVVTVAAVALIEAVGKVAKYVPLTVTVLPTGPPAGENDVIVGGERPRRRSPGQRARTRT